MSPDSINSIVNREAPGPLLRRIASYRLLHGLAFLVLVLDQLSKIWVIKNIPYGAWRPPEAIEVVRDFFYIIHVGNTGAAWSVLTGRSVLLASIAALTLVAIFIWRRALGLRDRLVQLAFGLLIGGIIGNLIDRIVYKHVVDFVDLHFGSYVYPTFNVADSGICIGVAIYLWASLKTPRK